MVQENTGAVGVFVKVSIICIMFMPRKNTLHKRQYHMTVDTTFRDNCGGNNVNKRAVMKW